MLHPGHPLIGRKKVIFVAYTSGLALTYSLVGMTQRPTSKGTKCAIFLASHPIFIERSGDLPFGSRVWRESECSHDGTIRKVRLDGVGVRNKCQGADIKKGRSV